MGFNYVVMSVPLSETMAQELPIIYPDILVHADVAESVKRIPGMEKATPVSAGSVELSVSSTHGRSTTLNLKARADDASLIGAFPYFHGLRERPEVTVLELLYLLDRYFEVHPGKIDLTSTWKSLGLDRLDVAELALLLDREYGFVVESEELFDLTIKNVIDLFMERSNVDDES